VKINADFTKRVVMHGQTMPWVASPMAGVERRMLDRIGKEVARATSIVRYAPSSHFAPHTHEGGEEFIVLDGVFQDEHGDYPAGSYVRNPPTSSHQPRSADGCTIFVKLWQFDPDDRTPINIDTTSSDGWENPETAGIMKRVLFNDANEIVTVENWAADTSITKAAPGGAEIFVLDGSITDNGETLQRHSWLRIPPGASLDATAGKYGARVWMKSGHLGKIGFAE
jgi:anti-sigma factor ChrR (cupin superfamily)